MTGIAAPVVAAVVLAAVTAAAPWATRRSARRLVAAGRRTRRADPAGGRGGGHTTRVGRLPGARDGTPGVRDGGSGVWAGAPGGRSATASRRSGGARWWPLRRAPRRGEVGDPALLLDLVAVALAAGASVPAALAAVGAAWPGAAGDALVRAAGALELGAPWDVAWSGAVVGAVGSAGSTGVRGGASAVAAALEPAWRAGASPVPLLRAAAERIRSRRRAHARAAAGRLGVQLVVPLGVCFLPAFVLLGLVPVVVSLAGGLLG